MNREIKFRGKRVDNGEWVYGDLKHNSDNTVRIMDHAHYPSLEVRPETVGQFTGLHDKNGKEIFEWDKVKVPFKDGRIESVISWAPATGRWVMEGEATFLLELPFILDKLEVIGTIHDTSDGVEGEEQV